MTQPENPAQDDVAEVWKALDAAAYSLLGPGKPGFKQSRAALDRLSERIAQLEWERDEWWRQALDWQQAKSEADDAYERAEDERLTLRAAFYKVQERAARAEQLIEDARWTCARPSGVCFPPVSERESSAAVVDGADKPETAAGGHHETVGERQGRAARVPNRAHRECFWTWPFGHVYKLVESIGPRLALWECAACGKRKIG